MSYNINNVYANLCKDILANGNERLTRNGNVLSLFGKMIEINMDDGFPLLTTKKMYTKGIIHELLWFISGDTNIKYLLDNNVNIWNQDAYRYYKELAGEQGLLSYDEFIDAVKEEKTYAFIHKEKQGYLKYYKAGDLGKVYGKQWRSQGAKLFDQLSYVIEQLKTNPSSRRIIVNAWRGDELDEMALPPCHVMFQFYANDDKLSLMWTQRSVDVFLGLPFNIASYALLLSMVAHCTDFKPYRLIGSFGDTHIYKDHIEAVQQLLNNDTQKFNLPHLILNPDITEITDFKYDDIKIIGYESYPKIEAKLLTDNLNN